MRHNHEKYELTPIVWGLLRGWTYLNWNKREDKDVRVILKFYGQAPKASGGGRYILRWNDKSGPHDGYRSLESDTKAVQMYPPASDGEMIAVVDREEWEQATEQHGGPVALGFVPRDFGAGYMIPTGWQR